MRTIVIAVSFVGVLVSSAFAAPITKVPNATFVTKTSDCQTTCYNSGTQRICNTHCY
jgi:hypothetical protein